MADNENVVTERICKIVHKQVDEKFDSINSCIKEIRDAVSEMREIASGTKEIINILMEERKLKNENDAKAPVEPKSSFWNTKAGALIPWLAFAVVAIIIVALVGTNLIEGWQQVKDYIPKG
jgi:hypothetical protein